MAKVFLDPGHGGHDPGAVGNGLQEKVVVLKIARYARNYLQNNYKDVSVKMSRTTDKYLSLSSRANAANNWGADLFVSIHINAGGGIGYEDYIYNGKVSNKTHQLQDAIHSNVAPLFTNNRGQKRANFAVIRQTSMPAVLTECGFIDNKTDANFLKSGRNLKKLGEAHAKGIAVFLGLEKVTSKKTPSSTSKKKSASVHQIYRVRKSWSDVASQKGAFSKLSNAKSLADRHGYNVYNSNGKVVYKGSKFSNKPKANLTVDGKWGPATTRALQRALGTPVDGVISSQPRNSVTEALYGGVTWGSKGSPMVRELQRIVGAYADGKLGPATIRQLQRYLKTPIDGVISRPSSMVVEELQRKLNAGTLLNAA